MVSHSAKKAVGLLGILLMGLLWCATVGQAASSFTVQTDRQAIYEEESFRLIFETGEEVSGTPDFSVLEKDFEVLGKQQGSTFQSINGQSSHKTTWTVTLLPKRSGSLTIPPIAFGSVQSPAYTVTIRKGSAPGAQKSDTQANDLFLEVSVTPKKIYVQSQVIYTVRFFRSVEISGASLTEPQLSATDAVVEKLGEDHTFETTRQGTRYLVVERRYALYPQRSGSMTITPLRLEAQVGKRGIFGLFEDPFNAGVGSVKRRHSEAVTLEVEPIPGSFKGAAWLPAHRLQLMEKWSENPPKFQVGEAITRTLTLLADGLTSAQLPEISDMAQQSGSHPLPIKLYPDQPALTDQREPTGIIGMRQEKVAMVPAKPGSFILPAIQIAWWNVDTQREEVAELPEQTVTILPGTEPVTPTLSTQERPSGSVKVPGSGGASRSEGAAGRPVADIPSGSGAAMEPAKGAQEPVVPVSAYPSWLTHFLAIGWAVSLLMVWLWPRLSSSRRRASRVETPRPLDVEKQAELLKIACLQNNPEKCREALLKWAQACWPEQILGNLNDLQRFFEQLQQALPVQEMVRLNQALYSPTPGGSWSGQGLWHAVQELSQQKRKPPVQVLPPLYSS